MNKFEVGSWTVVIVALAVGCSSSSSLRRQETRAAPSLTAGAVHMAPGAPLPAVTPQEYAPDACQNGKCFRPHGPEPVCATPPKKSCKESGPNIKILAVTENPSYSCALLEGGCVRCWYGPLERKAAATNAEEVADQALSKKLGGPWGVLGRGHAVEEADQSSLFDAGANVELGGKAIALGSEEYRSCALLEGGCVRCWGGNEHGELGLGHTRTIGDDETPASEPPVRLGGKVLSIALEGRAACALLEDGAVRCWGGNEHGETGLGVRKTIGDDESPLAVYPVELGAPAKQLVATGESACALLADGKVRCWGGGDAVGQDTGDLGDLGDNESPMSLPPVPLPQNVVQLAAAIGHACALTSDGRVRCWGDDFFFQLGTDAPYKPGLEPLVPQVKLETPVSDLLLGASYTCMRDRHHRFVCFGRRPLPLVSCCHHGGPRWPYELPKFPKLPFGARLVPSNGYQLCYVLRDRDLHCLDVNAVGEPL